MCLSGEPGGIIPDIGKVSLEICSACGSPFHLTAPRAYSNRYTYITVDGTRGPVPTCKACTRMANDTAFRLEFFPEGRIGTTLTTDYGRA